ncbi:hypothetical protein BH23GEM6_BH23GEM6_06910 [soil metagenome]
MRYVASLMAGLALFGCATGGSPPAPASGTTTTSIMGARGGLMDIEMTTDAGGTVFSVDAPVDRVWTALTTAYNTLDIPVSVSDARARSMGNTSLSISRSFAGEPMANLLSCGVMGGVAANNYRIQMSLLTNLTAAPGGGTRVRTIVSATGRDPFAANPPVQCASTFNLERKIAILLNQQLQPAS